MALTRPPVVNPFANTVAPPAAPGDLCNVPSYIDSGFPAPGGDPVRPPIGFFNWLFWFLSLGVRYLLSRAFTPWDSTETQYTAGSMVEDSDGRFYVARGTPVTGTHPSADPGNWFPLNMLDRVPAIGSGGDWVAKIAQWKSPVGLAGFTIDRWGLPRTNHFEYKELWGPSTNWGGISLSGGKSGPWTFNGTGPNSSLSQHPPGALGTVNATNTSPSLEMTCDGSDNSYSLSIELQATSKMSANALLLAEFESTFVNAPTLFTGIYGIKAVGESAGNVHNGAYFAAVPGNPNWICRSVNAGTTTPVDSGVLVVAGLAVDLMVVLAGSSVTDDFTPHAVFFINGVLVANITTNVPNSAASPVVGSLVASTFPTGATGPDNSIVLGPTTYTQITKLSTP